MHDLDADGACRGPGQANHAMLVRWTVHNI